MSKTIKIQPDTYQQLDEIRRKGETFSEAVGRLLSIYNYAQKMYQRMIREKTAPGAK